MAVSFPGKLLGLIEIIAGQADRSYFPRGREIARGQRINSRKNVSACGKLPCIRE